MLMTVVRRLSIASSEALAFGKIWKDTSVGLRTRLKTSENSSISHCYIRFVRVGL